MAVDLMAVWDELEELEATDTQTRAISWFAREISYPETERGHF